MTVPAAASAAVWLVALAACSDTPPPRDAPLAEVVPDARARTVPDASTREVETYLKAYTEGQLVATYPSLVDIRSNLVDDGRYAEIGRSHARAAPLLREFVKSHVRPRADESAAFLAVDFVAGRAFYKLTSDRSGRTVRLPGWDRDALAITELVDEFLEDNGALAAKEALVESGSVTIDGAFAALEAERHNPFIFDAQLARYTAALKQQVASDAGRTQMAELRTRDPKRHEDIEALVRHVSEQDLQQLQEFEPPKRVKERFDRAIQRP